MKINKILAAGIAATLAVTSLSAVAYAEEKAPKSFDIYTTVANFGQITVKLDADVNKKIAQNLRQAHTGKIILKDFDGILFDTLYGTGFKNYLVNVCGWSDANATTLMNNVKYDASVYNWGVWRNMSITATGYQHAGDTATNTKTFQFDCENKNPELIVLDDTTPIYHEGEFASYFFNEITSLSLTINYGTWGNMNVEELYNYWNWINDSDHKRAFNIGDIAVYDTATATVPEYTYGAASETSNALDLVEIYDVQAKQDLYTVTEETATDGSTSGLGIVAGSSVLSTDVGSPLKTNQKAAAGLGTTVVKLAAPEDAIAFADDAAAVLTKATSAFVPGTTIKAIVADTKAYAPGQAFVNIVNLGTGEDAEPLFAIVTNKVLTDAEVTAINTALAAYTAETDSNVVLRALRNISSKIDAIVAVPEDEMEGTVPVYTEYDRDEYEKIVPAKESNLEVDFTENGALIWNETNNTYEYVLNAYATAFTAMNLSDTTSTAHLLAYAFANGGWFEGKQYYGDSNAKWHPVLSPYTDTRFGWLPKTTNDSNGTKKNQILRNDVWLLSSTSDYDSLGKAYSQITSNYGSTDYYVLSQTYDATMQDGTKPLGFAGLASQVADYFNKESTGLITFTFTAQTGATGNKWQDGIPSTEVGLKGYSSEVLSDFALFFNYNTTTGTMLSNVKVDPTAGTVAFDITDYLDECGGLTKSTLHDIYYGLDNGIYDSITKLYGLRVSKIELSIPEASEVSAEEEESEIPESEEEEEEIEPTEEVEEEEEEEPTEEEEEEEEEEPTEEEGEPEIEPEEEEEEPENEPEEEEGEPEITPVQEEETSAPVEQPDAEPVGDVVITTPTEENTDPNPGTGVALAVIPAIAAAAAIVVSKKRK